MGTSMSSCGLLVCVLVCTHAQPGWLEPVQSGFGHQTAGRWVEAVGAYRAAIAAGLPAEHQLTVATNLGLALQNTGALDEALLMYDKVLSVLPTNADTHHNRGNALYQAARPPSHVAAESAHSHRDECVVVSGSGLGCHGLRFGPLAARVSTGTVVTLPSPPPGCEG